MKLNKRITIITGHYGSGKTNIAVNIALNLAKESPKPVTIVDLDIVNPYFRTADFTDQLEEAGIKVIAPLYARTNLDSPALPPEIAAIFTSDCGPAVIDVGGDDAGAVALGQFSGRIEAAGYDLFYVINAKRYLTREPEETVSLLRDIEAISRLKATRLINNTNLGRETTVSTVLESVEYAEQVSKRTMLPIAFTCVGRELAQTDGLRSLPGLFPVELLSGRDWV